jgi:hypothetical protein
LEAIDSRLQLQFALETSRVKQDQLSNESVLAAANASKWDEEVKALQRRIKALEGVQTELDMKNEAVAKANDELKWAET